MMKRFLFFLSFFLLVSGFCHANDGKHDSDDHVMPGEGDMPLPELMQELKEINYQNTATLELVTGYINEPRFYAKRAINNIREMMK